MKCPRDNTKLEEIKLDKKNCKKCPQCKGYFIGLTGPNMEGVSLSKLNPKAKPCALPAAEDALLSPASNRPMKHFVFQGIKLDYCEATNAVWMDPGELQQVMDKFCVTKEKSKVSNKAESFGDGIVSGVVDFFIEMVASI